MGNVWDETSIREEIKKLDEKTGLKGAEIPISLDNSKRRLGAYSSDKDGTFFFSKYYFFDPTWPVEEALDTIRHEYAHYMDFVLYGNSGHGATWKKCCIDVGALPVRCYIKRRAQYYQDKHENERRKSADLDQYKIGDFIDHPKYGRGKIIEIEGEGLKRYVIVEFENMGNKKISLAWIDDNCC